MGLFRRNRDAQGFYQGDAPVSAPGIDGAAPSAYPTGPFDAGPFDAGPFDAGPFDQSRVPPGGPSYIAPGTQPPNIPSRALADKTTTVTSNTNMTPQAQAAIQMALNQRPRSGKAGGIVIVVVLLAVLVPIGIAVYFGLQTAKSAISGVEGLQQLQPGLQDDQQTPVPDGRHQGVTAVGEPVAISFDGADFQITAFGAVSQPGNAWGYARAGGDPILVVDAQISRIDTGTEPIRFLGWNWSVVGSTGEPISGDIITNYLPALDRPELVGGQTLRGFVTFATPVTQTSLTVAGGPSGAGLATWQISAATPKPVAGVIGEAAQGEISRPGFTVTVGEPGIVLKKDKRIGYYPESGRYLVLPVEFSGVSGTQGHIGNVDSEAFVFKPDGAPALFPTFGGVTDAFSFVSIDASEPEAGFLAFDTAATSGTLQLRDGADRTVISWQISVG